MILACPSCATRYQIDGGQLGETGAKVRCIQCNHLWHAESADLQEEPAVDPVTSVRAQIKAAGAGMDSGLLQRHANALLGLAIVVGLAFAFWASRDALTQQFPGLVPLYESLGMHIAQPGEGLTLSAVRSLSRLENGTRVVTVEGVIENTSEQAVTVPALQIRLLTSGGSELRRWVEPPPRPRLQPGRRVSFSSSLPDAPDGQVEAAITFIRID